MMMKNLRQEGFEIGRDKTRRLMKSLQLKVKQKRKFKVTTDSNHKLPVATNVLNREFSPSAPNQAWGSDITYLWTQQGWIYLAVIIDLYSRRVVGWSIDRRMKKALVIRALMMAVNLRKPPPGLIHHSDRGSQYASHDYQKLLKQHGMICSMSRKGNCWDNSPVERFFGSLKREWTGDRWYRTRQEAIADVREYVAVYYNSRRLHSTLGYSTPMDYEKTLNKVSGIRLDHYIYFGRRHNLASHVRLDRKAIVRLHIEALPALAIPVLILGGIYSGIVTVKKPQL